MTMIILMIDNLNPIDIANIKITGKNQPSGIGLIIKYIIDIYKLYLNQTISYYFLSPCLRINCFLNNNWPKEIKNEIEETRAAGQRYIRKIRKQILAQFKFIQSQKSIQYMII